MRAIGSEPNETDTSGQVSDEGDSRELQPDEDGGAPPPERDLAVEDSDEAEWDAVEEDLNDGHRHGGREWIMPTLALTVIAGWTVFFGYTYRAEMLAGASAERWIDWIGAWSLPVLIVIAVWLLAMRTSRREAARFTDAAHALSQESALLEDRLTTVNRELSLAREFLTAETRELETLGRVAGTRISEHADRLQALVADNSEQVDRIGRVSETALGNMDRLRDELPVIANSARDTSNQIGAAGEGAREQLDQLVSGFERLNLFGKASEEQVALLTERVDATLAGFEAQLAHLAEATDARFTQLREASDGFRGDLDSREVEALAAMRRRMDSLGEELSASSEALGRAEEDALDALRERMGGLANEAGAVSAQLRATEKEAGDSWSRQTDALRQRLGDAIEEIQALDAQALEKAQAKLAELRLEAERVDAAMVERDAAFGSRLAERRSIIEETERDALAALDDRLNGFDERLEAYRTRQDHYAEGARSRIEETLAHVEELAGRTEELAGKAARAQSELASASDTIAARIDTARKDAGQLRPALDELTEVSVRLLELIQAGVTHSRDDLPGSLAEAERRLAATREAGEELRTLLDSTRERSEDLSGYVIATREETEKVDANLDTLDEHLGQLRARFAEELAGLRSSLADLEQDGTAVGERTRTVLQSAISELDGKARDALSLVDEDSRKRLDQISHRIGQDTAKAVETAVVGSAEKTMAELDRAAANSASAAREAARQLRDQLSLVNELAGNLENRVALARERAEERVDNDFARRVALITEALNSNAIDIAKALSSDVTDTAWAAYLRGDRGIFTRRAVSLLDNTDAREIAEMYDSDADFREHVSRYIHDFEAMLRTMLSTRDGNALAVTLLSSDMGKLYVAMAQAIERLREG